MARKLAVVVIIAALGLSGFMWYKAVTNTPDRAADRFARQLAKGEVEGAYQQLTPALAKGREQYWKDYLAQFKNEQAQPRLVSQDAVRDDFNTYTDANDPQRFIYELQVQHKTYRMTIIVINQDKTWSIDELHGGYL